jgi:hypothetical protein
MTHPQYRVRWEQGQACTATETCIKKDSYTGNKIPCSRLIKQQHTFAFFKPEAALDLATFILKQGHTLLFVEQ